MAEQVPYGVAVSVINRLASLAFKEIAFIYGVDTEIERLKDTAEAIKAVLLDAERKQRNDQLIKLWIRRLKQVLLKVDDLLDDLQTQHLLCKRDGKTKVRDYFSSSNPIAFRLKIARKIRKIREQFNSVAEDVSKLNLDSRVFEMRHSESNWRETSSKHEENIIGREESKKQIIDLLLDTNSNQSVSVVAIVGMGGLGKTALAQLVYNNAQVNKFFNKQMWVCASQEFHLRALVKKILESSIGNDVNDQQLQLLQNKLEENLNGQRYLLVLDDVWNEDREQWLHLKKYLTCGVEGSKILVTTRNQMVARCMGAENPFVLNNLTNDQSWALLKSLTFGQQDRVMTQNIESIGQKIAEKCGGVPLAIRAMGSMLSKIEENNWESILDDDFWKLYESNNSIMPVLKLSYDQLSFELRQCFSYCSLYTKNWRYDKDDLIELWMAQGFLESQNEKQSLEDIGEEYVYILLKRSFLEDVEMNEFGEIKYFKIHNLIHDLLQSVAGSDCYLYNERRKMVSTPMHVSIECDSNFSLDLLDANRLRTMLGIQGLLEIDPSSLLDFKCLRTLNLSECLNIRDLPSSIGKMKHLRYLNLSHCENLTGLPMSVSNLVNLQTLKLTGCFALKFPIDWVTKLVSLRRLHINSCKAFEGGMPIGLEKLTALQSLSDFKVGNDSDKERKYAKLNELKELNLRHGLCIENLNLVREVGDECEDVNLKGKKNLKSLRLDWGRDAEAKNSDSLLLLEKLCPHPNLKQLTVEDYPGVRFSGWLSSLTNLVDLKLDGCRKCQYLPSLQALVSLKNLCIWNMDYLEYICDEGCSSSMAAHTTSFFPSLKDIYFSECENFRGFRGKADSNNEMHHSLPPFPCLSYLIIQDCPNLTSMPAFNLVERLVLKNCNTKPLIDTVKSSTTIGLSATQELHPSLSMLEYLGIQDMDVEALPEEWMRNLSSLKNHSIGGLLSLVTVFRQMIHLPATLEQVNFQGIHNLDPCIVGEGFSAQCKALRCLSSLQTINILFSENPRTLPDWICDLQSLQFIVIHNCRNLESLPDGLRRLVNLQSLQLNGDLLLMQICERGRGSEWPKIAHIPNIWVNGYQI